MKYLIAAFIFSLMISCKNQTPSEMIMGTWSEQDSIRHNNKLSFIDNKLAVYDHVEEGSAKSDTMEYELSTDGKRLKTTEKSGKVYDLEVFRLTKDQLILVRKDDTLRLLKK